MYLGQGLRFIGKVRGDLVPGFSTSTTLARRYNLSYVSAALLPSLIAICKTQGGYRHGNPVWYRVIQCDPYPQFGKSNLCPCWYT